MGPLVNSDKRGFTLVEALVAIVVLIFGLMSLFSVLILSMQKNVENSIRDAAVRLAESRMNQIKINPGADHAMTCDGSVTTVNLGNVSLNAMICDSIATTANVTQITVVVGWDYGPNRPQQAPTGRAFQHSITSIITR